MASLAEIFYPTRKSLLHVDVQDSGIFGFCENFRLSYFLNTIFVNFSGNRRLVGTIPDPGSEHKYLVSLNLSNCNLSGSFRHSSLIKLSALITFGCKRKCSNERRY